MKDSWFPWELCSFPEKTLLWHWQTLCSVCCRTANKFCRWFACLSSFITCLKVFHRTDMYMVSLFVLFNHSTWSHGTWSACLSCLITVHGQLVCPVWSQYMVSLFDHCTWSACLSCLITVHGQFVCPVWSQYMVSSFVLFDHSTWSARLSCLITVHGQLVCPVWSQYMVSSFVLFDQSTWSARLSCLITVHGQLICPVWSQYMVSSFVLFDHSTWSARLSCLITVHGQLVGCVSEAHQEVQYAAYRTALKLRHLQKTFGREWKMFFCLFFNIFISSSNATLGCCVEHGHSAVVSPIFHWFFFYWNWKKDSWQRE